MRCNNNTINDELRSNPHVTFYHAFRIMDRSKCLMNMSLNVFCISKCGKLVFNTFKGKKKIQLHTDIYVCNYIRIMNLYVTVTYDNFTYIFFSYVIRI